MKQLTHKKLIQLLCQKQVLSILYDFGRYVAGLTFVKQLTGLDISNVTFKPTKIDDSYRIIAIESAINAVEHPEQITESLYK